MDCVLFVAVVVALIGPVFTLAALAGLVVAAVGVLMVAGAFLYLKFRNRFEEVEE